MLTPSPYQLLGQQKYEEFILLLDGSDCPYDQANIKVAKFLLYGETPNSYSNIEKIAFELEALRHEAGFSYQVALDIRKSIFPNNFLNQISILDIELTINPISECDFSPLEEIIIGDEPRFDWFYLRVKNILDKIEDNYSTRLIPENLLQFTLEYLESRRLYQQLGEIYLIIKDHEKSSYFFNKSVEIHGYTPITYWGLAKNLLATNRPLEAIHLLQKSLILFPQNLLCTIEYAVVLDSYGENQDALDLLSSTNDRISSIVARNISLANFFRKTRNIDLSYKSFYRVIRTIPLYYECMIGLGSCTSNYQDFEFAQHCFHAASNAFPLGIRAKHRLASLLGTIGYHNKSLELLEKAYTITPFNFHIVISYSVNLADHGKLVEASEIIKKYLDDNNIQYRLHASLQLAKFYLDLGLTLQLYQILDTFQELIIKQSNYGNWEEWMAIYHYLAFIVPSARDDILFNSLLFHAISDQYRVRIEQWKLVIDFLHPENLDKKVNSKFSVNKQPLRVGFMSPNFHGHIVGILSKEVILSLSELSEVDVVMIPINPRLSSLDYFKELRETSNVSIHEHYGSVHNLVDLLCNLELDFLIELDGATSNFSYPIQYYQPARFNLGWLGFDAIYASPDNYFLCDWFTHPISADDFYVEKLVRMPHSHMCCEGFLVADKDRDREREALGISSNQIAFIYTAAVRKFNFNTAYAHAQILKQVPNSIILVKTSHGALDRPLAVWKKELDLVGVDSNRVIPIKYAPSNEDHRFYFKMADIYLDAYPYNGGSQTLEALWCDLPVVTYCGEQSFARMGYSLLSTAGITEGIAHSWEEYIEWAVRLATDRDLRLSIKERLAKGKDPDHLCPLWNPKQFARDMYNILQELYEQAEV